MSLRGRLQRMERRQKRRGTEVNLIVYTDATLGHRPTDEEIDEAKRVLRQRDWVGLMHLDYRQGPLDPSKMNIPPWHMRATKREEES